jgi:uncharacterized protein DUF2188
MSRKAQHVVPNRDGRWSVRKTGAARVTKSFDSLQDALKFARDLARKQSSDLYIHARDGTIRDAVSYSSDPFPLRDGRQAGDVG